ncbi:undecaprenyl-diphosphate phosphatase [Motiliproteus coralliicola]|uniref:Undecaprenyl-diphosphatase n=1 Tax=Motiliproteus coralliicola TaxID=2283196 RepID=A0A369WGW0_9GAMM|nr:undecaprenyl-diphosphate phosphatase [Motiliproteus coralliicola]RDE19924.1 undecaprenyl-diphosphate phosphatase [Motiliproteus coralliicola]
MALSYILLLALIQGLTEFLPISSSAHLILPSQVLGWPDQGLAFDVAVHVGTLVAVLLYFRRDFSLLFLGWLRSVISLPGRERRSGGYSRMAWAIVIATIPAVIAGWLLNSFIDIYLRSVLVIAIATIFFGLILWVADLKRTEKFRRVDDIGWRGALIVGMAQAIALIPGTSRSGITITAGLMLGLTRRAAARFSFLMSAPLILAAGLFKTLELIEQGSDAPWGDVALGAGLSCVSAYLCIHLFMELISRIGMTPFVIYRLLLGLLLLGVYFSL